jgi:hypothetical protein
MIRRSLLATLFLLVTYEIVIRSTDVWWTVGQNQWQGNVIRANDFMYADHRYDNVMVGSSIANRLTVRIAKDSLPQSFYNLSFDGQSSLDGLIMLQKLNYVPRRLFIEINMLIRSEDKAFYQALFSPVMFPLKKYVKSFQEKYQPVEVISRLASGKQINAETLAGEPLEPFSRDEKSYLNLLNVRVAQNNELIPAEEIKVQIQKIRDLIIYFQQQGAEVIFFEVPVDPLMCNLPRPVQWRQACKAAFEPLGCKFIAVPDCGPYYTTDATHLHRGSVYKYLNYLKAELARQKI